MTTLNNTYLPSQLVSLDILHLLGHMNSPILNCAGKAQTNTFDESKYIPGMTVSYQVAGIPPVHRGDTLTFSSYEQRTLYIKADTKRWYFSVTHAFNQTDDIFYMNRRLITETLSAPTLKALKETIELEGAQWAKEHAPVIPAYGSPINAEITFPTKFNASVTNYLNKLRRDLIFPAQSYKLILNTRDDMIFSNSLMYTYSTDFVEHSVKAGTSPKRISDFSSECSPYLGLHKSKLTAAQARGPLRFVTYPTSDEYPLAVIKNMSAAIITLTAGDIIYQVADDTQEANGLYWIQNTVKRPIPDSRYAFCVTSDKYIEGLTDSEMKDFHYEDVSYTIAPGGTLEVSLSHKPIFSGYHQNCSREIATGDSGDKFYVLKDHYKNHALHPEYFKFKCFKIPPLKSTEHSYVDDGKTGVKMLVTHDRVLAEGSKRGNIFDVSSLPCFGAVSQNLFTLPVGEDATGELQTLDEVTTISVPQMVKAGKPKEAAKSNGKEAEAKHLKAEKKA
jgi:hypothetical protein